MACNCGKNKSVKKSFLYTAPDGSKTTYPSEIEARAAQIRRGGTYKSVSG